MSEANLQKENSSLTEFRRELSWRNKTSRARINSKHLVIEMVDYVRKGLHGMNFFEEKIQISLSAQELSSGLMVVSDSFKLTIPKLNAAVFERSFIIRCPIFIIKDLNLPDT